MTAIFFYVLKHRDSQIAYRILMSTKINFKPFEIKGKNVKNQLQKYGVDKVPTLYFPDKRAKIEGAENIARYLGVDLNALFASNQQPPPSVKPKRKPKKPKIEAKYKKALKDEYFSDSEDSFERKFKEAHKEQFSEEEDKGDDEDEEFEDESEFEESDYDGEGESDEISLEV